MMWPGLIDLPYSSVPVLGHIIYNYCNIYKYLESFNQFDFGPCGSVSVKTSLVWNGDRSRLRHFSATDFSRPRVGARVVVSAALVVVARVGPAVRPFRGLPRTGTAGTHADPAVATQVSDIRAAMANHDRPIGIVHHVGSFQWI